MLIEIIAPVVGAIAASVGVVIGVWTFALKLQRRRKEAQEARTLRIVRRESLPNYGPIDYRYVFSDGRSLRVWRTMGGGQTYATDMDTVEPGDAVYGEHIKLIEQNGLTV